VTVISQYAFNNCAHLEEVVIPDSVTEIKNGAFEGCTGLVKLTLPDSNVRIGGNAFADCSSLNEIYIPKSFTSWLRAASFVGCSGLTKITVESGNSKYDSRNECNAIIDTELNRLILGCCNTVIPDSVTEIGDQAFSSCHGLKSIFIPETVETIGAGVFELTPITQIEIPDSVKELGSGAFHSCAELKKVAFSSKILSIADNTFYGCSSLEGIVIPSSVTSIGYAAFANCASLKSLSIPSSVKSIDCQAFNKCNLEEVTLDTGINKIHKNAFDGNPALKVIRVPAKKADYYKKRLPEKLHQFIVEMEPEKKSK
jgi:hypothetical protein